MSDTEQLAVADGQQNDNTEDQQAEGNENVKKDKEKTTHQNDEKKKDETNAGKKTKAKKQEQKERATKNKTESPETEDDNSKQKEYFKLELHRLEDSLKKEYSKIQSPTKKPYTPYLFNSLEPYYNTHTAHFLIYMPEDQIHGFASRTTAQTLIDPWDDLRMSTELPPIVTPRHADHNEASKSEKDTKSKRSINKTQKENPPTRFPVIRMDTKDLETKPLFYSDVPSLREHLRTKYSANAQVKIDEDYKRTHHEFYRMELDRLDQVHPVNRKHMTSVYFAYLQNTPGSKKAVTECVGNLKVE